VGNRRQRYRRQARRSAVQVRHELSTRFVIPAGKPGVRAPQQRGDKHAASAEAVGERERPTSPACNIAGMWPDPADNEKNIRWVRDYYAALAPHSLAGGYVNFASADDQGARPRQLWPLLRPAHQVKPTYDPGNLFRRNQNILPG